MGRSIKFCVGCGRELPDCDGTCRSPLDPPRFCPTCGKKLFVQVTPTGYRAHCRKHGEPHPTS
ncbi:MAG: hypothetical protein GEU68_07270 [Actinobacteria bacterium]|nr:hypothetical protein [Actinomycetota bacterium]